MELFLLVRSILFCGLAFVVIYYGSRLLCIYVRKPLVEYCNKRGYSAKSVADSHKHGNRDLPF